MNKVDFKTEIVSHLQHMDRYGWVLISFFCGIHWGAQAQQSLGDRVADLEKKLQESREETILLAKELENLKKQAGQGVASAFSLNGYISSSFRWTPTSNVGNDLYALSGGENQRDRFALDVVSLSLSSIGKKDEWASGFNFQTWIGPGADLLGTAGKPNTSASFGGPDIAIKQAYIKLHLPAGEGLGMKVGVFDKVIGYESTDRNVNPFYSHSWGYTVGPRQHTGFIFDYGVTSDLKLHFGVANSTSSKINGLSDNDNRFTLIGALEYKLPDQIWGLGGSDLTVGTVRGRPWNQGYNDEPVLKEEYYHMGLKDIKMPIENLSGGIAWDIRVNDGSYYQSPRGRIPVLLTGNDDQVWGAYLNYEATDFLEFNFRGEKFNAGSGLGSSMSDGWGATLGASYKITGNTQARFEVRHDKTDEEIGARTDNRSFIWNLVYTF